MHIQKRKVLIGGGIIALLGVLVGIGLTARLDWTSRARAVEYFQEGAPLPTTTPEFQPTGFSGNLPSLSDLAQKVGPMVVNINTTKKVKRQQVPRGLHQFQRDPFFDEFFDRFFEGPTERPQKSLGSGFVINSEGYILTNRHVIEGADEIQVQLPDRKKFEAKIIGGDPKTDIAVIKINAKDVVYAPLGDSDQLRVGDWVMAVGNPFGLDHTVTAGIVSAKGRVIGAGPYDDFIQTDASINPGNSGGPLFNLQGQVVGINTAIVASGQGIGFAIPINMAKQLIPQLIREGKVTRAWLGVGIQEITPELAKSFGLSDEKGALVASVFPGSPAEKGGLKAGDIVRNFNGREIVASHDLPSLVAREPVNKQVKVKLLREGKEKELEITLGEMEQGEKMAEQSASASSKELGLVVREVTPEEMAELGLSPQRHGVLVVGTEPGGVAEAAGVQRGDVLLAMNDRNINSTAEYAVLAKKIKKGEIVRLFLKREEATIYVAFRKP